MDYISNRMAASIKIRQFHKSINPH